MKVRPGNWSSWKCKVRVVGVQVAFKDMQWVRCPRGEITRSENTAREKALSKVAKETLNTAKSVQLSHLFMTTGKTIILTIVQLSDVSVF